MRCSRFSGRAAISVVTAALLSCAPSEPPAGGQADGAARERQEDGDEQEAVLARRREEMVEEQIRQRDVQDARVLAAMRRVERHRFVPAGLRHEAYEDRPLPIGEGQTISQPYIVAKMTELAGIEPGEKVLEIGTGSGYQAAILGELGAEVYTVEIIEELGKGARVLLEELGYRNIHCRVGDGYAGWPEQAPFDAIVVTAAPEEVPQPLIDQLAEDGRLVIPVGDLYQELQVLVREGGEVRRERIFAVRFVPMTGKARERR
ncbi:MAG: protein-L-isoaspartate(D-aspartate) O-methyltransferase [Planctomycetes bacterium]|nr:protein-L-isoaspartate(D-aspartate) O-methyltransferase [Planctomycetota bacterium]